MNYKVFVFNVIAFAIASSFQVQASSMNCLVERHYVFTGGSKPFERGDVNAKAPTLSKGAVGKMFNVDLENGLVNNKRVDVNIIKSERPAIYQLIRSGNESEVIELLNLADDTYEPDTKMTFIYTAGLEVLSGYCQK